MAFQRLHRYNLKLSPGKARIGATHANFPGHNISPAGVSPYYGKVRALSHMPDSTNVKLQVALDTIAYLKNLATKVCPLNAALKREVPSLPIHLRHGEYCECPAPGTISALCLGFSGLGSGSAENRSPLNLC